MDNREYKEKRKIDLLGVKTLSPSMYNLILGGVLLWGIVVNIFMATFLEEPILAMNYWAVIIIYFVVSLLSMLVIYKSDNPVVSFLGFTILSIAMGLLLTYYVSYFDVGTIRTAFVVTAIVTAAMILLSTIFPSFFRGLGRVLFITLIITIIAEIVISLVMGIDTSIFDYIVVVIFCGYIGYDWTKAQEYSMTVDHAIDSAADIYVDIINLFVRILSILGRRQN